MSRNKVRVGEMLKELVESGCISMSTRVVISNETKYENMDVFDFVNHLFNDRSQIHKEIKDLIFDCFVNTCLDYQCIHSILRHTHTQKKTNHIMFSFLFFCFLNY